MAGITEDGFDRKTYSQIVENLKEQAKSYFGDDIDLTETSPLMQFINTVALEISRLWDLLESAYYSAYIDYASGESLDRVVALVGVYRKYATVSTGEAVFTGDNGSEIPEGTTIQTPDKEIRFETTETVYIDDGEATASIESLNVGEETNVAANTITELVDQPKGIDTVNNPEATTGGQDKETDEDLRMRAKKALDTKAKATEDSIEASLLSLDGVLSVSLEELDDRSINIIISGGDSEEITDTLEETRAFGIPATWERPTEVLINVEITVETEDEPSDAESQIEDNITEYIESLGTDDDVIYTKLYDVIYDAGNWVYNVSSLEIGEEGETLGTSDITIASDEKAIPNDITVSIS